MKHEQGILHNHGIFIHITNKHDIARNDGKHGILARMNEVGTAYQSTLDQQEANASRLVECWNEHDALEAKAKSQPDLLEACKWINKFMSTACDGGDAWCAVRNQPGASDWAESMAKAVARAEAD
jgi:hypothetical protein